MAGPDDRDRHSLPAGDIDWMGSVQGDLKGTKVGYSADWGYAAVEPEVREIVGKAVKVFERDLGCHVEEVNPGWPDPLGSFLSLLCSETDLQGIRGLVQKHGDKISTHVADFVGRNWTAEQITDAVVARKMVYNKMWRLMRKFDILLTPTLSCLPFPIHMSGPDKIEGRWVSSAHWLSFTFPINMTGQPAASVPAGWTKEGLPVGLQIVGPHLGDAAVLRASAAFEKAAPWRDRWPPILKENVQ